MPLPSWGCSLWLRLPGLLRQERLPNTVRRYLRARDISPNNRCRAHGTGAGATSARGVPEFVFNLNLAERIKHSCLMPGSGAACFCSPKVHHGKDWRSASTAPMLWGPTSSCRSITIPCPTGSWRNGSSRARSRFSDRFHGHSIFISQDNTDRAGSLLFARMLGNQLLQRGLNYTPHYTERYMGNRQRVLVDAKAGVYRYDQLLVLQDTTWLRPCSKQARYQPRGGTADGFGQASSADRRCCG